ncbi:MAG: metal ABC transporter permease, partial [Peptococcaceae bacterium]|nr:metal ABC transporter permease [Peptococcaceae bacterium]
MEILQYGYMNRALLAGITAGIICPVVGIFIVLRRMSLIADALSHLSLAGVAAGLLAGTSPLLAASLFSVLGAVFVEKMRETYRHYAELSIAIMLSTGLALGAVLLGLGHGFNASVLGYLFGSIVAVSETDVLSITAAGVFVLGAVGLLFKELYFITFDEEAARASGLPVAAINIGFTVLTSLTIAVTMRIVGILLVSSLMILPVAASLQLARSFKQALQLAVLFGLISVFTGLI